MCALRLCFETATTLGSLTGVLLIGIVPSSFLYSLFTVILFLSARQMLATRRDPLFASVPAVTKYRLDSSYPDKELGREVVSASLGKECGREYFSSAIS
jgi:uncharacterized membrane protein YfcA